MNGLSLRILAIAALPAALAGAPIAAMAADNQQTSDEFRTSKLVGPKVYNQENENIGSVEDIVLKADGSMDEVVLSVGGFVGIGEKFVSVPYSDLTIGRDGRGFKISTNGTKESLKALPDYQYFKG